MNKEDLYQVKCAFCQDVLFLDGRKCPFCCASPYDYNKTDKRIVIDKDESEDDDWRMKL